MKQIWNRQSETTVTCFSFSNPEIVFIRFTKAGADQQAPLPANPAVELARAKTCGKFC